MATKYEVQQTDGLRKWRTLYYGKRGLYAYQFAGYLSDLGKRRVRIIEKRFKWWGKSLGEIEFGVNPPWWSRKNGIKSRNLEVYLRGVMGDIDFEKSEILKYARSQQN